jgi:hypothetical protein
MDNLTAMDVSQLLRWGVSGLLGVYGIFQILANWYTVISGAIRKESYSLILLLGGIAAGLAIIICPATTHLFYFAWVPLLLDPGCLSLLVACCFSTDKK